MTSFNVGAPPGPLLAPGRPWNLESPLDGVLMRLFAILPDEPWKG